jgi:hypothetical protein
MENHSQRDRIFLLYGKAAFHAQLLEESFIQLLLDSKWTTDVILAAEVQEHEKKLRKLTLGQLVLEFKKLYHVSDDGSLAKYLKWITNERRNKLVHHFFIHEFTFHREWGSTFQDEERTLQQTLIELEQATNLMNQFREQAESDRRKFK